MGQENSNLLKANDIFILIIDIFVLFGTEISIIGTDYSPNIDIFAWY